MFSVTMRTYGLCNGLLATLLVFIGENEVVSDFIFRKW